MRLLEVIRETAEAKYRMHEYPIINGQKHHLNDQRNPMALFGDVITVRNHLIISPNSKNFLPTGEVIPTKDFLNFASNKYTVDFYKISKLDYHIHVIGYGGFMSNMFHFINLIAKEQDAGHDRLAVTLYENDEFSAMNNVRTFQDTSLVENEYEGNKLSLGSIYGTYVYTRNHIDRYFETTNIRNQNIYVGSPDFDTRILLQDQHFLFFGNSNSDFVIHKSPVIDPSMTRETYGRINIPEFWVGILEATYEFLRLLETESIRTIPHNTEIWSKDIQVAGSEKRYSLNRPEQTQHRASADEWTTF